MRSANSPRISSEQRDFLSEHELVIHCRHQREFVAISPEMEFGCKLFRNTRAHVETSVSASFRGPNGNLKTLLDEPSQKPKERDEVALTSTIGSDEDVKRTQFEVFKRSDRFESFN